MTFTRAEPREALDRIARHWESLPTPVDSFVEDHVRESSHYLISTSGAPFGIASIHGGGLITQFCLDPAYQRFGLRAFQSVKNLEDARAALVPTCDEFYLSHAIDEYRQLAKQACLYHVSAGGTGATETHGCSLTAASAADRDFILEASGDFFDDVDRRIEKEELFLTRRDGTCVGFGIFERSPTRRSVVSLGMFTIEAYRDRGFGAATIALLIDECARRGLTAVAGCWYYNHPSRRALERAGMVSRTRLLRVEY